MSNNGWIKLHRQITENVLWKDDDPFDRRSAWIDLLLMVNHEDREIMVNGNIIVVQRGQTLTSDIKLAERWRWSRNRVRRYIAAIEAAKMVTVKRTCYGTWLNVVNYAFYQGGRTGNGTGNDTSDGTTDGTANDTTGGTQTINIKNIKKVKNDKREGEAPRAFSPPDEQEVRDYCRAMDYKMNVGLFMAYYEARDWCLSHGKKMADWKKAVTAWAIREKSNAGTGVSDMQADEDYKRTQEMLEEYDRAAAEATTFKGSLKREVRKRMNK